MSASPSFLRRFSLTTAMVAAALIAAFYLWDHYMDQPWTRDGRVRAEVVAIAPDESGFVTDVLVRDNQKVQRGDVLFRLDRARFALIQQQGNALVEGRRAVLDQATSDLNRAREAGAAGPGIEKLEQLNTAMQQARAAYDQAIADAALAQINYDRSEVRAPFSGTISNMQLQPGAYVPAGKGVMALIDSGSIYVEGYFEETKLARIHVGDPVSVQLLGEKRQLTGHVESIAGGIEDRDRSSGASLLPAVNPTFSWVRLAQRVPVRVALDPDPGNATLIAGRTATVVVLPKQ
ncbi:efflux RND transporter periplasmic adaptor subunit [Methylovirgula sp. 4M-Z18]|uniref:efflux RND transporter periplasmic adaptor subunit n=1 Tax=Methylovirgula sp. 4M-Z18 TaxID=2293567 RepID=UPI000E2FE366|nr:HlyD family secretion protein [Methylovirgula sp. 4M-Z18]RFB79276.1 HlyD family secretion protein [Methylovirgula sp. 4M-Z18]